MGFFDDVGGFVFGNSQNAGLLGLGQYGGGEKFDINQDAFKVDKLKSYGQEQDTRAQINNLAQTLLQQSQGLGPSLAQGQLQDATDRNISQQQGLAASARGVNPALAQRLAAQNIAGLNQSAASDSALLRNQEMLQAQQGLASVLGAQRGGDLAATERDLGAATGLQQLSVNQAMGQNQMDQAAYNAAGQRRSEFISKLGQGAASLAGGGAK